MTASSALKIGLFALACLLCVAACQKKPLTIDAFQGAWRLGPESTPAPGFKAETVLCVASDAITLYTDPQTWIRATMRCQADVDADAPTPRLVCPAQDGMGTVVRLSRSGDGLHLEMDTGGTGFFSLGEWRRAEGSDILQSIDLLPTVEQVCARTKICLAKAVAVLSDPQGLDVVTIDSRTSAAGCYAVRQVPIAAFKAEAKPLPPECALPTKPGDH